MRRSTPSTFTSVILTSLLAACAGGEDRPPQTPAPPPAAAPAPTAATPPPVASVEPKTEGKSDKPDLAVVHRIKEEAYKRSRVMDHLFWLSEVNGPRLTASPGFRSAADWAVKALASWGVDNPHLESWGKFGRAWTVERFELSLLEPSYARLAGYPKAWSRGSGGDSGGVVLAPFYPDREDRDDALDLAKLKARIDLYAQTWRGKLHGKFVLFTPKRDLELPKEPNPLRLEDKKLGEMVQSPERMEPPEPWTWPLQRMPRDGKKRAALTAALPMEVLFEFGEHRRHVMDELWRFFASEGVLGVLSTDDRGEGSLAFVEATGVWESAKPLPPPTVVMPPEDYDRLVSLADKKVPAKVHVVSTVRASDHDEEAYNVVGEIPGGAKKDELVIIGAHLDSWHAGTGATDNGAGCAVMLEAMRILKKLALPMSRTVRVVLWSGEEEGLWGSRGYVKQHFADPVTMALRPEHEKVSVYFNLDNGTGRIRGVYLQENDMARPIFEAWLAPFKDEGANTFTIRNTGGTDHLSFDEVGIPGFQFIQDPLDYGSRTHHSNLDVYEHAQPGDLMQAAAIIASLVYDAANRAEMVPRKPLPPPLPPKTAP